MKVSRQTWVYVSNVYDLVNYNQSPSGNTLDIECEGVLSTGVDRTLVGNRVGVDLTQSTIRPLLPSLFPVALTGQHPWLHPGWKILPTRIGLCSNTNSDRRFRFEDNNVAFTHVKPHYYRVRQVEPCHQLG